MVEFGSLRVLARDLNFTIHGLPATVLLPDADDDEAISTRAIWLVPPLEQVPQGTAFARAEPQSILALSKADVPTAPTGTRVIVAPMYGADLARWIVDGFDRIEPDHHRVIVVRDSEYEPEET